MRKIFLFIVLLSALVSCDKKTHVPEKKEEVSKFKDKEITAKDGKIVALFDGVSSFLGGNESQILSDRIAGFLNRQKGKTYPEGSYWHISETMEPLLTTLWDQYPPFNNLCPKLGCNKDLLAPTGCVTCSVAQFLAYYEFPPALTDYKAIKNIKNKENPFNIGTPEEGQLAAKFIADISTDDMLDVWYMEYAGETCSFATPLAVVRTLKSLGYENVKLHLGLDVERVVSSLKKGNPVLVSALGGEKAAHGWVIDGYIRRELVSPGEGFLDTQYLLHFNWGWNGKNNGYFDSGILDTTAPVIPDGVNPESRDYIFSFGFNTITAEKPVGE